MKKDEKVIVVLLVMVVASITILYFMAGSDVGLNESGYSDYSDSSNIGDSVIVNAKVLSMRTTYTGDHLVVTVEPETSRSPLDVFIRNSAGADEISKEIIVGDMVIVKGKVDEYEGAREIIVNNRRDVLKNT